MEYVNDSRISMLGRDHHLRSRPDLSEGYTIGIVRRSARARVLPARGTPARGGLPPSRGGPGDAEAGRAARAECLAMRIAARCRGARRRRPGAASCPATAPSLARYCDSVRHHRGVDFGLTSPPRGRWAHDGIGAGSWRTPSSDPSWHERFKKTLIGYLVGSFGSLFMLNQPIRGSAYCFAATVFDPSRLGLSLAMGGASSSPDARTPSGLGNASSASCSSGRRAAPLTPWASSRTTQGSRTTTRRGA